MKTRRESKHLVKKKYCECIPAVNDIIPELFVSVEVYAQHVGRHPASKTVLDHVSGWNL